MQDLNDMLFFAEVVDRGGFAAASRALNIPKSRLSRRVAELEERLGLRLLQRTTRKLSLTEAGDAYLRHCIAMREQAQAAEEAVSAFHGEPRGTVRVTCPVTLAQVAVGPVLPLFLRQHPHVRVDMQVTNRVVDLVQEGVDVALRVRPAVEGSGSLVVKRLGETRVVLVASRELLDRVGRASSPDDLARFPTVAMSAADGRASWTLTGPKGESHELQHRPVYTADDMLTLRFAVAEGVGMCILPDYLIAQELNDGSMEEVLPGWGSGGQLHAVFPSRRGLVPAVRRFLDFLGEHVRGEQVGANCPGV